MHSNAVNHYEHGRSLIALQLRCTPGMIWHQVPRCGEKNLLNDLHALVVTWRRSITAHFHCFVAMQFCSCRL